MTRPALYTALGIAIGSAGIAAADLSPHAFILSNWAKPSAPLDIRPDRMRGDKAAIKSANARAAARHNVPVEFMDRLTMRESGFRFVKGPQTQWGRAHGPHQILCSTARELGEPDCNRLMHDAERSADLSARYVRMGYEATGSWRGAAAHYHGGPNTRLWGRKTAAYASAVGGKGFAVTVSAYAPPRGTFGTDIIPSSMQAASWGGVSQ